MTVSLILDALILLIAGLTIFFAVKNGFVKTVQSVAVFVLSIVVTLLLRQPVVSLLQRTSIPQTMENSIVSVISGLLDVESNPGETPDEPQESASAETEPSFLQKAFSALGIDAGQYRDLLAEKAEGTAEGLRQKLCETVVPKTVSVFLQVIAVVALFVVSNILLRLLFLLMRKIIDSIGILRSANRVLGLILGILLAAFRVLLFVSVVGALLNVSAVSQLPVFSSLRTEDTYIFRWIQSFNPLNAFFQ